MKHTAEVIARTANELGFRPDSLEKVLRLLSLLEALRDQSFLRSRLALKGGTALNLFVFDVPRLSVDIDLNYVGSADRETMLREKPSLEQAIQAVCAEEGLQVRRQPGEHAGGKWRLSYATSGGSPSNLEVDLNYMLRAPLWPVQVIDSKPVGPASAKQITVLDPHELAAGKLAALCARRASRDLFDAHELLRRAELDRAKLRLAFVVYGGFNREDWRAVSVDDIGAEPHEVARELIPMLRAGIQPPASDLASWTHTLVTETRELMSAVLPLAPRELEFLERLNGNGEVVPELLSDDRTMQEILRTHPALLWKAQNVRKRQ